jgi:pyridoxine 5-phosphate synthase
MPKLGVNVDHVGTLRQARGGAWPDPVQAALIAQKAGAHSIVMHLREDRRHIQDADLFRAKKSLSIRLNLEMSAAASIVKVAARLCPDQATLVPEKRQEKTTEGGLDLFGTPKKLWHCIETLKKKKITISLFIDPEIRQIREAARLGVEAVEFHTGDYANQMTRRGKRGQLDRLKEAVCCAREMKITAHAGHGLDYENVKEICKIKALDELNIGYAIVARALWVGMDRAVRQMLGLLR